MAWDDGLTKDSPAYAIASASASRIKVIAGPGAGKSYAMKRRVARLLEAGVFPNRLLAVTFTRVAAEDMHRELCASGAPGADGLKGMTLHSLALQILFRRHVFEALGRVPRVLNKFETEVLVQDIAASSGGVRVARDLIERYTAAWARRQDDEPGFVQGAHERQFLFNLLDWLEFHQAILIGEVIPLLIRYLRSTPLAPERREFAHLLVDEYQDLNKAEQTAIEFLGENADVCIIGDDDQSIYGFKFAHPSGIRQWHQSNPDCALFEMAECYRCPTRVVEIANSLILANRDRVPHALTPVPANGLGQIEIVQLADLDREAEWIVARIKSLIETGAMPRDVIVLANRSVVGNKVLAALKFADIPVKSYFEENQLQSRAAEERVSLLKLIVNRDDRVALRFLLGAGPQNCRARSYARIRRQCEATGDSPWSVLERLLEGTMRLPHVSSLVVRFGVVKSELERLISAGDDVAALVEVLVPNADADLSALRELMLEQLSGANTPRELLERLIKEISQPEVPPAISGVRVMSLHKSKGLSSPYVFIAGCVEGVLPPRPKDNETFSQRKATLEEARRLFYVGITRVKANQGSGSGGGLFISYASRMPVGEARRAGVIPSSESRGWAELIPSRFLEELGPSAPAPVQV